MQIRTSYSACPMNAKNLKITQHWQVYGENSPQALLMGGLNPDSSLLESGLVKLYQYPKNSCPSCLEKYLIPGLRQEMR